MATLARQIAPFGETGPPWNSSWGLETVLTQSGSTEASGVCETSFKITPRAPSVSQSKISTTVWLKTPSASRTLATSRSPARGHALNHRRPTLTGAQRDETEREDHPDREAADDDPAPVGEHVQRVTGTVRVERVLDQLTDHGVHDEQPADGHQHPDPRPTADRPAAERVRERDQDHR